MLAGPDWHTCTDASLADSESVMVHTHLMQQSSTIMLRAQQHGVGP